MSISYSFPKEARLRKRREFLRLRRDGAQSSGHYLDIQFRKGAGSLRRLGITVTKKYGRAHERNRFKRQMREAFRLCQHQLPVGLDCNVRPRRTAKEVHTQNLIEDFLTVILSETAP